MASNTLKNAFKIYKNILTILLFCSLTIAVPIFTSDIPEEVTRVEASIGGYAVLDCHLDFPFGNEIPYHLQWDKDGEWILSWYSGDGEPSVAPRYTSRLARLGAGHDGLGRGSVNVSAIREADAGLYRCTVSFPNRTPPTRNNGTFYSLEVNGSNLIVSPPVNATVLEGEPVELECQPKTTDSTVQWFKNGRPLEEFTDVLSRVTIGENGSLVIPKTEISDPGEYSCSVTDKDGLTQTASAVLDVQYKAKVVYAPSEVYLPLGKAASLDCHFSANPPLTNLRWEKDGFLFDPYNVPGVFYSRNGSLLFNKVEESHEGSYSCTPYNALGSRGASVRVAVRVLRPAAVRVRPLPLYVPRLGHDVTLPCAPDLPHRHHQHAPPFQIYWTRKDGSPLPPNRWSLSGGNLTITNISATDGGHYVCVVQNEASAATAATELRIENLPPRAPQSLSAVPTPRSIKLRWKPGQSNVETEYTIWYRQRLAAEWRTVRLLSLGVTEATVLELRPSTEYELRVLAQDPIGDGLFSRPIFVTTLEVDSKENETASAAANPVTQSAGQMAPLEVSIRLIGSGALVSWGRAGSGEAGPGFTGDDSLCNMRAYTGSDQTLTHDKQTNDHYAMIPSVAEGERYWVQVECEAAVGSAYLQVHLNIHEYPTGPSIQPLARGVGRMRSGGLTPSGVGHRTILGTGPALPTDKPLGITRPAAKSSNVTSLVTEVNTPFSVNIDLTSKTIESTTAINLETLATKPSDESTALVDEVNVTTESSKQNILPIPILPNISNTPFKVDPKVLLNNMSSVAYTTVSPSPTLNELSVAFSTVDNLTENKSTLIVVEKKITSSSDPNILLTASNKGDSVTKHPISMENPIDIPQQPMRERPILQGNK